MTKRRILVVDDEAEVAKALHRLLRREYEVEVAHNGRDALEKVDQGPFDLVLSDFRMPGMNGAQLLGEVRKRQPLALRLILSGFADLDSVVASVNEGEICRFLRKPWINEELLATLRQLLDAQQLLAALYGPFRDLEGSVTSTASQDERHLRVRVSSPADAAGRDHVRRLLRGFVGTLPEAEIDSIAAMLESNAGTLSYVIQLAGEQQLMLELPASRPGVGDTHLTPARSPPA